jgi:hypothetical protein
VDEVLPVGVPASACYLFDAEGQAFARNAQDHTPEQRRTSMAANPL